MTDRDESGQFTSGEPLTGLASVEAEAGYTPLPEAPVPEPEGLTVADAAAELEAQRNQTPLNNELIRTYSDGNDLESKYGTPKETVTAERAAKDLSELRDQEAAEEKGAEAKALRDKVDGVRDDVAKKGFEAAAEANASTETESEASLERALSHPRIKEAIESQIGEAEKVRTTYSQSIDMANAHARAMFIAPFPEIAQLPLDQWEPALAEMARQQPARFARALGTLQSVARIQQQQVQQHQQHEQLERQKFEAFSRKESAKFDEMVKGESKETRRAVEDAILDSIRDYGGESAEFLELFKSTKLLNSSVMQRMLWDAGKYRQMQKAPKPVPSREIPKVSRPGVSDGRSKEYGDLDNLERQLTKSGSIKDAVKLRTLRARRG
jgi:uncharacterized protein YmfQ (DUF2313 family)